MSPSTITLLFLLFAVIMFVIEKIPLGVTSMIVCIGLTITDVLDVQTAFAGFTDSNVILFVAMFIVGGADPRAVLMACVIGGSCAYATPIGMPANTMVVGVGGYRFMDFVKAGFPLIIIATVVSMIILPIAFPFFP